MSSEMQSIDDSLMSPDPSSVHQTPHLDGAAGVLEDPEAAGYPGTAGHAPVLVEQVLELLDPQPGQVCLDGTVGRGGHASVIAARLAPGGCYIGLDVDAENVAFTGDRLRDELAGLDVTVHTLQANFVEAQDVLRKFGFDGVDLLLADLGFASNQVQDPQRGLSFQLDGPLDMRLDPRLTTTAADLVNQLEQHKLADLIYFNSGERRSRRIAKKIVEERQRSPIQTTAALAQLVRRACAPRLNTRPKSGRRGPRRQAGKRGKVGSIHPATRTFMALRIAVNAELDSLGCLLDQIPDLLGPNGIAAVISFHSLEDRLVKQAFMRMHRERIARRLTPKPWVADTDECRANPRSRSAKIRAVQKLARAVCGDSAYNDIIS